ncbi:hypothetical protein JTB14_012007 [Gonioctena quinquepunctata]|nr:hypothetical protein JTB14_012007 [Gonioctena quinquepunctata]
MKKYHQLLLLVVSIVSLSLFLIYRHEYNRLHYVLEVFNFFGQPCNFSELQKADFVVNQHDWGPLPVWQQIDYAQVYSAFLSGKTEVKAIALQNDPKNVPRSCYLWFEDKKKPIPGKFKFSKITNDGSLAYFYFCSMPKLEVIPFAVSFSNKPGRESELKKTLLVENFKSELRKNITVCVSPSTFTKKRLVEFLSFHKIIGIDSFIFYGGDIPYKLSKLILNLSDRLEVQVTFLPWNYPKKESGSVRTIVENDCLLRTFRQSKYVLTLETNEYLLPINSLHALISDMSRSINKLALPVKKICVESLMPDKPIALQNFEAINDSTYNIVRNIYRNDNESLVDVDVVQGQALIHKYVRCNVKHFKTTADHTMNKYSTDLIRSTLMQLLIHGQL